jgi:hypothetical protein
VVVQPVSLENSNPDEEKRWTVALLVEERRKQEHLEFSTNQSLRLT